MNQNRYYLLLFLILITAGNIYSTDRLVNVTEIVSVFGQYSENTYVEEFDSNTDGSIDYLVGTTIDGVKMMESIDFNYDGEMDDFYFYSKGTIVRREIDSNFDMKIDVWVYIKDGSFIEKYEQDLDFDGIIDKVTIFEGEQ